MRCEYISKLWLLDNIEGPEEKELIENAPVVKVDMEYVDKLIEATGRKKIKWAACETARIIDEVVGIYEDMDWDYHLSDMAACDLQEAIFNRLMDDFHHEEVMRAYDEQTSKT